MAGLLEKTTFSEKSLEIPPRHFSIPLFPQSIQPTSLEIPRQAAHPVALSVTCLQPSVKRQRWNGRLPWSQLPTYLVCAGDGAGKCAEGIHGRAASHKHLSTNTGPRASQRPLPFSKENIRQEGLPPGLSPQLRQSQWWEKGGLRRHVPLLLCWLELMTQKRSCHKVGLREVTLHEIMNPFLKLFKTKLLGWPKYRNKVFDYLLGSLKHCILTKHAVLHNDL